MDNSSRHSICSSAASKELAALSFIQQYYQVLEPLGSGSYGQVFKGKHLKTGETHAIKYIANVFYNAYEAKKICREIKLLRKLSKSSNIYSVNLYDVIIPT